MKWIPGFLLIFLVMASCSARAARVDTVEVTSLVMNKKIRAAVVLPDSYKRGRPSFPVLYLLHGAGGNFRNWLTATPDRSLVHRMADQYGLIIVTPDGGAYSYYYDSPVDSTSRYETFITQELVDRIDSGYSTIADRKGRVIAGLSMGGHGAMYLAARHPDRFCAAGSMSGVMNVDTRKWIGTEELARSRAKNFEKLLGPARDTLNPHAEYTITGLTDRLKANDVRLIFDCGVDDFLIETNRELHRLLVRNGTPHDYIERPGRHDWPYWENALPYQVLFFSKVLQSNGSLEKAQPSTQGKAH